MLNDLVRAVSERRNYPTFLLAGALVFAGSVLLDQFDIRSGFTMLLLIVAAALGACRLRPLVLA